MFCAIIQVRWLGLSGTGSARGVREGDRLVGDPAGGLWSMWYVLVLHLMSVLKYCCLS